MSYSVNWLSNPQLNHVSRLIVVTAFVLTLGKHLVPDNVLRIAKGNIVGVLMLFLIIAVMRNTTIAGMMMAMALLLLYVGVQGLQTSESFCPYVAPSKSLGEDASAERCNATLHPELQQSEDVPTLDKSYEWCEADGATAPSENVPSIAAFENTHEGGADFDASFQ